MQSLRPFILAALVCLLSPAHAADRSQQLAERLKAAVAASTLDPSLGPWHWKLDVTLYDAKGQNPQQGTIEVWASPNGMRTVETLGATTIATLRVGNQLFRTPGDDTAILPLDLLLQQALKPIPDAVYQPKVRLKLVARKAGQQTLDCIEPTLVDPDAALVYSGTGLSYCLAQAKADLSLATMPFGTMLLRARTGKFLSIDVPLELQVIYRQILVAKATTTILQTFTPQPSSFQPSPELSPFSGPVTLSPLLSAETLLDRTSIAFPPSVRANLITSAVDLKVLIGVDGKIVSTHLVGTASRELVEAVDAELRQRIYRPFLLNGIALQVKSEIVANYSIR
ncbi:MAG: hypothetical protein V4555_11195 [Acidobacteriota bacterium]